MRMIRAYIVIGLLTGLYACSIDTMDKSHTANLRISALHSVIKTVPLILHDTCTLTFEFPQDKKLYEINSESSDSLFFQPMTSLYGLLADTNSFYSILSYAGVENGALTLTTIDKKGVKIDEKQLSTDLYGSGCGYQWHGTVFLDKDNSFLIRDSLITFDCDSIGPQPENKWKHEIATRIARISSDGNIELTKLQRKTVKK